jgi:hypothetical protein
LVEGGEDEVDAVFVDDVDEGLEVAAGGVVLGVVLHFTLWGARSRLWAADQQWSLSNMIPTCRCGCST